MVPSARLSNKDSQPHHSDEMPSKSGDDFDVTKAKLWSIREKTTKELLHFQRSRASLHP
jgi:hypothetical protein